MLMPKIGIQLYTLRDYIKTYEDTEKTFEFVKGLGTNVIQISGIGPIEPEKVAHLVDKYGMDVCVTHKGFDRMQNDLDNLIEEHKMMHCDCLGIGGMPKEARESAGGLRAFIKEANEIGRKMKAAGVKFAYHNHAFEFQPIDGEKTIMDLLIEEGDPEYFNFIPDVYWIQVGGQNPAEYLKRLKGRVKVCHFKDGEIAGSCPMITELGVGEVDLDACFKACMELDIPYIVYEQDNNFDDDPLKSTEISYRCLEKLVAANS
jgi:sugar phosphate isomerase/epimerase